jgi:hypothetical protein
MNSIFLFQNMPYAAHEIRWNIVYLWKQGLTPCLIANTLTNGTTVVSSKTAKLWIYRFKATGDVECIPKSGRKRVLDHDKMEKAYDLLVVTKLGAAKDVANQLFSEGLTSFKDASQKHSDQGCQTLGRHKWDRTHQSLTWEATERALSFYHSKKKVVLQRSGEEGLEECDVH